MVRKYFPMENKSSKPTCFRVFQCSYYFTLPFIRDIKDRSLFIPQGGTEEKLGG